MRQLVYFTLGHSAKQIPLLRLAAATVHRDNTDVWVLCDESLVEEVQTIPDLRVVSCTNSPSPETSSMRKLDIFDYEIQSYSKVLFLDSDILVHGTLQRVFDQITNPEVLQVCTENTDMKSHTQTYWSLHNYTREELKFFEENQVHVFNAGCFAFIPSDSLRQHFQNVRSLIANHTGPFFYEQSFMNAYFNRKGCTDRNVLTPDTYVLFPRDQLHPGKIVHFTGYPGDGGYKLPRMEDYVRRMAYDTQPSSPFASMASP